MSERIKQLAEEAGVDYGQTIANVICGDEEFSRIGEEWNALSAQTQEHICNVLTQSQMKFTELIVRECIEINKQELSFSAFERLMNVYEEHFGVKEYDG